MLERSTLLIYFGLLFFAFADIFVENKYKLNERSAFYFLSFCYIVVGFIIPVIAATTLPYLNKLIKLKIDG